MLSGHYEAPLVLVSTLVAVLASYTTLSLAERVANAPPRAARWWIAGGAFAMGTGIWSMHFLGMLAFRLPIPLAYDLRITLLSWVLPMAVSAAALWILRRPVLTWRELGISAVLLGLGINAMHYVGMAALRMDPDISYQPGWLAASVAIAIASAGAALWIAFRLRDNAGPGVWLYRAGASVLMGGAIVGMHYSGMEAAAFPAGSICRAAAGNFTLTQLATLVIGGTVAVLAIALLTAVYDARLESRNTVLALSQETARERQVLLDRERALREEAERLSALKDEFLATLSHELRTPLNAVLGWSQILRAKRDESTFAKGVETIERNARLQAQLIDDLLDMSRIVSGRLRIEPEIIDVASVLETALEAIRPAAAIKSIRLQCNTDGHRGFVRADPVRLQQVLWNLLTNAVKFTPEGGTVAVQLACRDGWAQYEVSDSGIGIAPAFLPYVFDRFRQGDASTARRYGGLGLGLAIVRQLVELHGGTVSAHSAGAGQGATLTVRIPLFSEAGAESRGAAPSLAGDAGATADLTGLRVLVVDDEGDARRLVELLLGDRGATVHVAPDARAALDSMRERAHDVLLSDIGMPEMDGFALIRELRADGNPRVAATKAIALTAFARPEDRERALREGFDAYLPKPVDVALLLDSIVRLCRPAVAA
jgi:signal transduction histidine kinase/ActR/RegA family two-component response regulator